MGEVMDRAKLKERLEKSRAAGAKIVFTNGCFDILHRGHAECMRLAKEMGDVLVVGVNTDDSVRRLKGPGRPFFNENDRSGLVAALKPVDFVCMFDEDTPLELIRELRPQVLVKGNDYRIEEVVGAKEVRAWGGEVRLVELVPSLSTTELVRRIVAAPDSPPPGKPREKGLDRGPHR